MSATTSWWYCGSCGFKNHPRMAFNEKSQPVDVDPTLCEQCGASQQHPEAIDYKPVG
jgi:hypothetical protein